jgi:hypothetical protein
VPDFLSAARSERCIVCFLYSISEARLWGILQSPCPPLGKACIPTLDSIPASHVHSPGLPGPQDGEPPTTWVTTRLEVLFVLP